MPLRSRTSTVTSASPGYHPLSRTYHATNISSVNLQGGKKKNLYEGKTRASSTSQRTILSAASSLQLSSLQPSLTHLYSPLSSLKRTVHYYIIVSLHVKVNYIMYAIHTRKYCRDSISQLRQGKLQSQFIYQRSLTGTGNLSKQSSFPKCFPNSTLN